MGAMPGKREGERGKTVKRLDLHLRTKKNKKHRRRSMQRKVTEQNEEQVNKRAQMEKRRALMGRVGSMQNRQYQLQIPTQNNDRGMSIRIQYLPNFPLVAVIE